MKKSKKDMTNNELLDLQKKYNESLKEYKEKKEILNAKLLGLKNKENLIKNELELISYELENRELREYKKLDEEMTKNEEN